VRFAADNHDMRVNGHEIQKAGFTACAEAVLGEESGAFQCQRRHGRPKSFWVLLSCDDADAEFPSGRKKARRILYGDIAVVDRRHQLGLEIDYQQDRAACIDQGHVDYSFSALMRPST